jgi:hypothetical protein
MSKEPENVAEALAAVEDWLPRTAVDEEGLFSQRASARLSDRFMMIAGRAGFGMGIVRIDEEYTARWTHPKLNGSYLPESGFSFNEEDARIRACSALLKVPKAVRLLDQHRLTKPK